MATGIDYRLLTPSAGAATSFSDTFHRANVANLGPNWVYMSTPTALSQIHTTAYSVNANAFQCLDSTASQTQNNSPECFIPFALINSRVAGKSQGSQTRFLTTNTAAGHDMRAGVITNCGLNAAGDFQMYLFWIETGLVFRLEKYAANTFTDLAGGAFGTPAANDVMKLSVTQNGPSATLNCFQNGTNIKSVTDNTPITTGWPGLSRVIWISGVGPPATSFTFDNFTAGVGL